MSKPSLLRRIFAGIWKGITWLRLGLSNILFLVMLGLIYFIYVGGTPEPLPEKAALLLNISGTVVDQKTPVDPLSALMSQPDPADHEVRLRDIIEAIDHASADDAISSMVLELDALAYIGISKTQEVVAALQRFRQSGKSIVAVGDYFTQDQYLLASYADEVIVHPLGGVLLEGYASYNYYFREALDKLSVNMHVFRAGEYKSAVEPFLRDDMSPESKEVTQRWLQDLWQQYVAVIETERNLAQGAVAAYIDGYAENLTQQGGDAAKAALEAGLVDRILTRSEANDFLIGVVGASNDDDLFEAIEFERYVARKRPLQLRGPQGDRVAVISAVGNILPGRQPPGSIGGDSLAGLIRSTAEEEGVKAIVLRVNSGGGSMFASEVIRQQVIYARDMGVPVVVSMGAVAASGGYYIAAPADEIWATPSTITGSIGVFAAFPTFEDSLARVGVSTDGLGTTKIAGSLRADRALQPEVVEAINSGVAFAYDKFLEVVATGRNLVVEDLKPLAEGRVWSAGDALQAGLVDKVGSLEEAIVAAASLADMHDYEIDYVQLPLSPRDLLLQQLANRGASLSGWARSSTRNVLSDVIAPVVDAAHELSLWQDPNDIYMRCTSCPLVR